jgi:hypothetical protein
VAGSIYFDAEGVLEPVDGTTPLPAAADGAAPRTFLLAGRKATALDVDARVVTLDNGLRVQYGRLLLATGGVPRQLGMVKALPAHIRERVTTYRKVADFRALKRALTTDAPQQVVVIGGGFLGSELAVAIARQAQRTPGVRVTQVFPEEGNMGLVFPRYLSQWTSSKIRDGAHCAPRPCAAPTQGAHTLLWMRRCFCLFCRRVGVGGQRGWTCGPRQP